MRSLSVFVAVACFGIALVSSAQGDIEYLYGVSDDGIYLIQVDHTASEVSSDILFPFAQEPFYGAAGSGDSDYFWATSRGDPIFGVGSALYKIYPAERAAIQIGVDYGQNPRHPGEPAYRIRIMELAYDDGDPGILYGTDYLGLYSIDTVTGQATFIGDFGNGVDGEPIDMAFSMGYDSQTLALIIVNQKLDEQGSYEKTHMYTVNPATAAVTFIADTTSAGMTDVYESHTSDEFFGCSNAPKELFDVNSGTGIATSLGLITSNILGMGGDFVEVAGPKVGFSSHDTRTAAGSYSKLDGQTDYDYDNDRSQGGIPTTTSTAEAFVEEAGEPGLGQRTTMVVTEVRSDNSTSSSIDSSIDFSSVYDGLNSHGGGWGTATLTWDRTMQVVNTAPYSNGDRVIVLIEGNQTLNDEISHYVLDWELEVYDSGTNRTVALLTEEDAMAAGSSPFLAAFQAIVEIDYDFRYRASFTLTLDVEMLAGDISADGKVNMIDFALLSEKWMDDNCDAANLWCDRADINESDNVDQVDLALLATDWVNGNVWDDDNQFNLDLDFVFRSIAMPETLQTLNDDCEDAIVITSDTEYFGNTQTATGTDISDCGTDDIYDVWYNFIPSQDGLYRIYVKSSTGYYSPCVSVFSDCSGSGSQLHCWDQYDSNRNFEATAGTSYLIRLAFHNSGRDDFKLVVIYYPPPANDECSGAIPVEMGQYYHGETYGATGNLTSSCGTDDTADVWYEYTAADDGTVVFIISPNDYNAPYFTAAVFNDCNDTPTELACAVYEGGGEGDPRTILVLEEAQPGHTYYVRVARNDSSYGAFNLDVEPGPGNDKCAYAESIDVWDYANGSTVGATGYDITSCGTDDSRDVWYELASLEDQLVLIRVSDYSYSGMFYTVSIFKPCGGVEQACAESSEGGGEEEMVAQLVYEMSLGETIYIRVAYDGDAMGQFDLNIEQIEPPGNDECVDAEVVEGGTSGSTLGASGSDVNNCGTDDTHDVWYKYTPETTDTYCVAIYGGGEMGSFGGTVAVYAGDSCSPLPTELGCEQTSEWGEAELYVDLTAAVTYLIRVASDDAGQGYFELNIYPGGPG